MTTGTTLGLLDTDGTPIMPQWSPVVTTGTTPKAIIVTIYDQAPQWSPVVTTGTTRGTPRKAAGHTRRNGARS